MQLQQLKQWGATCIIIIAITLTSQLKKDDEIGGEAVLQ